MYNKKIFFVSTLSNVSWGGSEELWSQTAAFFLNQQNRVTMALADSYDPIRVQVLKKMGAKWVPLRKRGFLQRMVRARLNLNEQVAILKRTKPALVVISLSSHFAGQAWMEACRELGIPYANLFQIVNDEFRFGDSAGIDRARRCIQAAACNFFVSRQNLNQLEVQLACTLSNAQVVWNPFKGDVNTPFHYPEIENDQFYRLAMVASITPSHKGQDILFNVLSDSKWRGRNLQISFFGKGKYEQYLNDLKRWYGLSNVTFEGHQEVHKIWQRHHGILLPSRKEGMSLALIEAMVLGRFGITTDVGGAREIIEDNVNGFIAKAPHPEFVDEALERAWQRRSEWKLISERAYHSIREKIPENPAAYFAEKILALL